VSVFICMPFLVERVVLGLFGNIAPKTVQNVSTLVAVLHD
jgi:cyclophilin family peptidyl-prolyl cis-trans isomerase